MWLQTPVNDEILCFGAEYVVCWVLLWIKKKTMTLFLAKGSWINGCSHFGLKCKCFQNKVRCLFSSIWLLLHIPTLQGIFRHWFLKESSQRVPNQSSLMDFFFFLFPPCCCGRYSGSGMSLVANVCCEVSPFHGDQVFIKVWEQPFLGVGNKVQGSLSPLVSTGIQERTWFLIEVFQTACCWGYTLAGSTGGFVKVI